MVCRQPLQRFAWILIVGLASTLAFAVAPAVAEQKAAVDRARPVHPVSCRRGNALLALGRVAEAEAAFEKELETAATVRCAREGLAKIGKEHPCAVAKALMRNGEKAEANNAYLESLEVKPAKDCAGAGADASSDPSLQDRVKSAGETLLTVLAAVFLGVVALTLVFLVLVRIQSLIPWLKNRWPAGKVRQARVTIEKFDDSAVDSKLGPGTTALLKKWIEADAQHRWVKLVSGGSATEETWLSKVAEVGEQGKVAAAAIGLFLALLPRRHVKVTGELQPAALSGGPGISLELHRKLASKGTAVLWAKAFALPVDETAVDDTLRRLVVPTAAWISHRVTSETGGKALAAGEPMSWALFKTGIEWQRNAEMDKAEELYRFAIAMDGKNYGARANLALLRAREGDFKHSIELLTEARAILEEGRMGDPLANPDWYRVCYSLTAEYANWALHDSKCKLERLERAKASSEQLHGAIAKTLGQRKWGQAAMNRERRDLLVFLRGQLKGSLEVLAAGIQIQSSKQAASPLQEQAVLYTVSHFAAGKDHGVEVEYNLACLFAQVGERDTSKLHLERAFSATNASDRLLFAWRIKKDTALAAVHADFLKAHPSEAKVLASPRKRSLLQRPWI